MSDILKFPLHYEKIYMNESNDPILQKIYLFNPDHDLALASQSAKFMPKANIVTMAHDLACLPFWWAKKKDGVAVPAGAADEFSRIHAETIQKAGVDFVSLGHPGMYHPWGWNQSLVHKLSLAGVAKDTLPDSTYLKHIRDLSGRHNGIEMLKQITKEYQEVIGKAHICRSVAEVESLINRWKTILLKAPWSGSGKGLFRTSSLEWNKNVAGWVERIIRSQGFVVTEPYYNRVIDFATEFYIDNGNIEFCGYSLFNTDVHGYYKGNVLLTDAEIEQKISEYMPVELLHGIVQSQLNWLNIHIVPYYNGYVGIDMMIVNEQGMMKCHPCVEINLRMTMGMVARILKDRWIEPKSMGVFRLEFFNNSQRTMERHLELLRNVSIMNEKGCWTEGYVPLIPVGKDTRFLAYMLIHR